VSGPARIGFSTSHEQFPRFELLRLVKLAEAAGFTAATPFQFLFPTGRFVDVTQHFDA
jgi:hypothetical protein